MLIIKGLRDIVALDVAITNVSIDLEPHLLTSVTTLTWFMLNVKNLTTELQLPCKLALLVYEAIYIVFKVHYEIRQHFKHRYSHLTHLVFAYGFLWGDFGTYGITKIEPFDLYNRKLRQMKLWRSS